MLEEIIQNLPPYVRLTGSYARGDATWDSDYDFWLPERYWESFKKWSQKNIPNTPTSCFPFTLTWKFGSMHRDQIEFSVIFQVQEEKLDEVILFGRSFKTR